MAKKLSKKDKARICPVCKGEGWKTIIKDKKGAPCPVCGIKGYDPDPLKLKKWEEEHEDNSCCS